MLLKQTNAEFDGQLKYVQLFLKTGAIYFLFILERKDLSVGNNWAAVESAVFKQDPYCAMKSNSIEVTESFVWNKFSALTQRFYFLPFPFMVLEDEIRTRGLKLMMLAEKGGTREMVLNKNCANDNPFSCDYC